jgi:hypothetical protein
MGFVRGGAAGALLPLVAAGVLGAQDVQFSAGGAAVTNSEIARERQAKGLGIAGGISALLGRFRLEARGLTASLKADFSSQPDYALHQVDVTATYLWRPRLGLQVGAARRFVGPDFAAQEVGLLRVGVTSEARLTSVAAIQGSIAFLPVTEYSGGGESGNAFELGLDLRVGRHSARWQGLVGFSYQRLQRDVNGVAAPGTFSEVEVGIGWRP